MKVCCAFSLESPHRGDSNEYSKRTIFSIRKKITINFPYLQPWNLFHGAQERVRNNQVKRAIRIRAIEVLLYMSWMYVWSKRLWSECTCAVILVFLTLHQYVHIWILRNKIMKIKFMGFILTRFSLECEFRAKFNVTLVCTYFNFERNKLITKPSGHMT